MLLAGEAQTLWDNCNAFALLYMLIEVLLRCFDYFFSLK